MAELIRGANAPLDAVRLTVTCSCAAPVDLSALLVGRDLRVRSDADLVFYNAPEGPGVRWSPGGIDLDLAAVPADVHAVLIALSLADHAPLSTVPPPTVRAGDHGFTIDRLADETALIALEVYRRQDAWKVRAVGQGYAAGLAALVTAHGVEVDDPGPPPPAPPRVQPEPAAPASLYGAQGVPAVPPPSPAPAGEGARSGAGRVPFTDRAWLVWEDASRSLASYRASMDHALSIRDDEVSGRTAPGRSQQLMQAATERLTTDMTQLAGELAAHEGSAGAELAPFDDPAWLTWEPGEELGEGLLLGHLGADEVTTLRIPLILRMPWRRMVWINRGLTPHEPVAFAWSLVTRFFAAVPPGVCGLDVVDATGMSGAGWIHGLPPATVNLLCGGGVATGRAAADRLGRLVDLVDLRAVGGDDTALLPGQPPVRLLVVFDAGAALEEHGDRLMRLVEDGPRLGVPVICVETETPTDDSVRALRIKQSGHTLPSGEGVLSDAWVGGDWALTPDVLFDGAGTRPPALLSHVLNVHSRIIERA
ncbi:TerD family protein [Actinocorallia populi]|uniref:TerD family protein n=1 Tax=Actinocorallia populi TaxID=2079200 RepID=UPI000D08D4E2|nr:TerD family protein [Actinocorallia populi]